MEAEARRASKKLLRKGADAAVAGIENMADAALAGASAAVDRVTQNAVGKLKGKGHMEGGHYYNAKGQARGKADLDAKHKHDPGAGPAEKKRKKKKPTKFKPGGNPNILGSGYGKMEGAGHMVGHGHMKGCGEMEGAGLMHGGRMALQQPTQRDDGAAAADSLGGLNYTGQAFVTAPVMQASPGAAVMPYSNHLRNMQFAPAGGYGGMGFFM